VSPLESLLERGPEAVNVGVREFAESLAAQDVSVVQVEWRPSPQLDDDVARLLEALT
jgi:hypothetical protein